jgi:hypothetical protein
MVVNSRQDNIYEKTNMTVIGSSLYKLGLIFLIKTI